MKMTKNRNGHGRQNGWITAAVAMAAAAIVPAANAATSTWDGGGGDDNWSTGANWSNDAAPIANDALVFDGGTRLTPSNDFAPNTTFSGITFNSTAGAFTLGGAGVA